MLPIPPPVLFKTCHRARRDRRIFAQQAPERQVKIALRQAMQIELGQKLFDFPGSPGKQRQYPTLETLGQASHPGPAHADGSASQREPAPLAVAIAVDLPTWSFI